jgi:ABC-type glycerol-3-phosphate transport system substrate-binding protein
MKKITFKWIFLGAVALIFSACSGGGDSDSSSIILTHNKSISCSDESSFTISPVNQTSPDITVVKNTTTGVTTITMNTLDATATIVGCTEI